MNENCTINDCLYWADNYVTKCSSHRLALKTCPRFLNETIQRLEKQVEEQYKIIEGYQTIVSKLQDGR